MNKNFLWIYKGGAIETTGYKDHEEFLKKASQTERRFDFLNFNKMGDNEKQLTKAFEQMFEHGYIKADFDNYATVWEFTYTDIDSGYFKSSMRKFIRKMLTFNKMFIDRDEKIVFTEYGTDKKEVYDSYLEVYPNIEKGLGLDEEFKIYSLGKTGLYEYNTIERLGVIEWLYQ